MAINPSTKPIKKQLADKRSRQLALLAGMVLLLFLLGLYVTGGKRLYDSSGAITYSTDSPDESKENAATFNWQGADDEPKKLKIDKIGVDTFIQKSGIDQNREIAVPSNVHLAGWFVESAKPGTTGLAIIAGHVTGYTTDGVFKRLGELEAGDTFTVELGNGTVLNYTVTKRVVVKEEDANQEVFSQEPRTKSQVNLVTCTGRFDSAKNRYEDRIVITASLE